MLRVAGAACVLAGGVLLRAAMLAPSRRRMRAARRLSAAFGQLAQRISVTLAPLPRLLRGIRAGEDADEFFGRVLRALDGGETLERAWSAAADALPLDEDARETVRLLGAQLDGGEESVLRALYAAARALEAQSAQLRAEQAARERLTGAMCLAGSVMLLILAL